MVELLALPPEQVPLYRCYTGHFYSLLEPLVGRELPTVTLLRDPFELCWSGISHFLNIHRWDHFRAQMILRCMLGLWRNFPKFRNFLDSHIVKGNTQTIILGGFIDNPGHLKNNFYGANYPFSDPRLFDNPDMDALVERAKERLRRMVVVGTVERFAESTKLIFDHLGVPLPTKLSYDNAGKNSNATTSYRGSKSVSADLASYIDRKNIYDRELHRYANSLLDARLASRS